MSLTLITKNCIFFKVITKHNIIEQPIQWLPEIPCMTTHFENIKDTILIHDQMPYRMKVRDSTPVVTVTVTQGS